MLDEKKMNDCNATASFKYDRIVRKFKILFFRKMLLNSLSLYKFSEEIQMRMIRNFEFV